MSKLVKIFCFLLAACGLHRFLLFGIFMPTWAYSAFRGSTTPQLLGVVGVIAAHWAATIWTVYFGWRAVITWGDASCGPALLMVLPIFLLITLALIAMHGAG